MLFNTPTLFILLDNAFRWRKSICIENLFIGSRQILLATFISIASYGCANTNEPNYTLTGYVKGFGGDTVMLAYITNLRMNPIDTAIAKDGKFVFNIAKRKAGMYSIIFDYGIYADIIVNKENIDFTSVLVGRNVEDSIQFTQSEENKVYYEYMKYKKWVDYSVGYEKHQGNKLYAADPVGNLRKLDSLKLRIDWLNRSISDKAYELYKKNSSLFVANKLKFYLLPHLEDYSKQNPDVKYMDEYEFLQQHFYDNINMQDSNLLDVAFLNNQSLDYISNYTFPQNTTNFIKSCDFILENMQPNKEAFCSVLDVIINQMENWHQDSVFVYLADKYYTSERCKSQQRAKALQTASVIKQLLQGNSFPDIALKDNKGTAQQLYAMNNKATLVFFWLSTCDHCERMIPAIQDLYNTYQSKGFDVYAVSMDTNKDYWNNAISRYNIKWKNVAELKGFGGEVAKQFNISQTPRMYLVDKDKKVIAHPADAKQLQHAVDSYFKD